MTREKSIRITNRLIDVVASEKDMAAYEMLCVGFAFCSTMVEHVLNTFPDNSIINEAKAGIKDVFISEMVKYVDGFEPKEE